MKTLCKTFIACLMAAALFACNEKKSVEKEENTSLSGTWQQTRSRVQYMEKDSIVDKTFKINEGVTYTFTNEGLVSKLLQDSTTLEKFNYDFHAAYMSLVMDETNYKVEKLTHSEMITFATDNATYEKRDWYKKVN